MIRIVKYSGNIPTIPVYHNIAQKYYPNSDNWRSMYRKRRSDDAFECIAEEDISSRQEAEILMHNKYHPNIYKQGTFSGGSFWCIEEYIAEEIDDDDNVIWDLMYEWSIDPESETFTCRLHD